MNPGLVSAAETGGTGPEKMKLPIFISAASFFAVPYAASPGRHCTFFILGIGLFSRNRFFFEILLFCHNNSECGEFFC